MLKSVADLADGPWQVWKKKELLITAARVTGRKWGGKEGLGKLRFMHVVGRPIGHCYTVMSR